MKNVWFLGSLLLSPMPVASAQLFYGTATDEEAQYGFSVDGVGDVDGDGYADFAIGAPHSILYFCHPDYESWVDVHSGQTGALIHHFAVNVGDRIGVIVRGVGDVNRDGVPDILAALAPDFDCGFNSEAHVYSGADGSILHVLYTSWYDVNEQAADGAGDANADGYADVIIGDPQAFGDSGTAIVYSGRTGSQLLSVTGAAFDERLGRYVAGVGDWDGDGKDDCAIGNGSTRTRVYSVASGQVLFDVAAVGELDDPGDFDGDGVRDLLIGGRVHSGQDGSVLVDMSAEGSVHRVATDFDADGRLDFVVGDPEFASDRGRVRLVSGATGQPMLELFEGTYSGAAAGFSVAPAGDTNGDGVVDLVIGAPSYFAGINPGEAYVFSGYCPPAPTNYCIGAPNSAGPGATMSFTGSWNISSNDLSLIASGCPPDHFGLFYYGPNAIQLPFGNGFRCVGGQVFRLTPPTHTGPSGTAIRELDYGDPPMNSGAGKVSVGVTWRFQFWYRDVPAGGAFFNLSDGLAITFCL